MTLDHLRVVLHYVHLLVWIKSVGRLKSLKNACLTSKVSFFPSAGVLCRLHRGVAIEKWVDLQVDLVVLLP